MNRSARLRWGSAGAAFLALLFAGGILWTRPVELPVPTAQPAAVASALSDRCPEEVSDQAWIRCVQDALLELGEQEGAQAAVQAVDVLLQDNSERFGPYCHAVSHNLGDQLGALAPATGLVDRVPYSCYGGFWHGYLSQRGDMLSAQEYAQEVSGLCVTLMGSANADDRSVQAFDCVHGVGHGLGMLRQESMASAFAWCAQLFSEQWWQYDCGTGVASAYSTRSLTAAGLLPFDHGEPPPADAAFPKVVSTCDSLLEPSLTRACLERLASYVESAGRSTDDLALLCRETSIPDACARSVGLRFGAALNERDASQAFADCSLFDGSLLRACLAGVLWHVAPVEVASGVRTPVCAVWPSSVRTWCDATLSEYRRSELGQSRDLV